MVKAVNDISKLTRKILDEAEACKADTAASAAAECARISQQFDDQARRESDAILAAAQNQAEATHRRASSQAGIESRNLKLAARREMIDKAFELAAQKLQQLPEDRLCAFLARMAAGVQTSDAMLVWGRGDRGLARKVVDQANQLNASKGIRIALADETGDFDGGFVLREGAVETNCTFAVLIKGVSEELEAPVAKALFD